MNMVLYISHRRNACMVFNGFNQCSISLTSFSAYPVNTVWIKFYYFLDVCYFSMFIIEFNQNFKYFFYINICIPAVRNNASNITATIIKSTSGISLSVQKQ